ncbi:pyridoxamine 5'-phosphate oxidase family protein [Vallitalea okinawensis]|uniref:pyridoxamine 5'-phosphate oxidase family protein n=1 Tax=Vallitalea okinawensis TaxID=2078660 RepID=UPI002E8DDB01|nr:pyridoxamine 5'-phosphate oxidase family protein [Vallitalea okinawensis]
MREMRRLNRQIDSEEEVIEILKQSDYGILATVDSNGQPYGVPVNYVYANGVIYFHCALEGHKLDNIRENNKISFTVVGSDRILSEKFTTLYSSVIVFGKAEEVVDDHEKEEALKLVIQRFSPDFLEEGLVYIQKAKHKTGVVKLTIDHMTGKRN